MRSPELKTIILKVAGTREFYGYEIHKELEERQIKIGIGRLYSLLAEMKNERLLEDRWEKSQAGPKRRVYRIGKNGIKAREKILMEAIKTVHDFYIEYLLSLPQEKSVFNKLSGILTLDLPHDAKIGYASTRFSGPLRSTIRQVRNRVPGGKMYTILPQTTNLNSEVENVFFLEGTFDDMPVKDNYFDLLFVTGNVKRESLAKCISEWHRVVSKPGVLAFLAPTSTITKYDDPLEIGEFVENREHPQNDDEEMVLSKDIQTEMRRYFKEVQETKIVHVTLIIGKTPK